MNVLRLDRMVNGSNLVDISFKLYYPSSGREDVTPHFSGNSLLILGAARESVLVNGLQVQQVGCLSSLPIILASFVSTMKLSRPRFEALQVLGHGRSIRTCPQCSLRLSQKRELSSTSPQGAVMGQMQMPRNLAGQAPSGARQSQQMMLKNLKSSQIPTDIGQLPLTFVSPPIRELFRMYRGDLRKFSTVLWLRIKRSVVSPLQ